LHWRDGHGWYGTARDSHNTYASQDDCKDLTPPAGVAQ